MAWEGAGRVQGARWMKSALPVNFQDAMQPSHAAVLGRNVAAHRVESCLHHHHHDVRGRRHQLAQHSNLVTCELCDITMAKDEWEQRKKGARHRRNTAASRLSLKGGPACSVSRPAISCRHNAARGCDLSSEPPETLVTIIIITRLPLSPLPYEGSHRQMTIVRAMRRHHQDTPLRLMLAWHDTVMQRHHQDT